MARPSSRSVSGGRPDSILKIRLIGLAIAIFVMASLVVASVVLRPKENADAIDRESILSQSIEGPEFAESSTTEEILAVAERIVEDLLREFPNNAAVLSSAARKSLEIGEVEKANSYWQKALMLQPDFSEALYGMALSAFESDKYEDALAYFQDVAVISPGDPRTPVMIAESLVYLGRAQDAILYLQQHLSSEQTSVQAWLLLGQAYLEVKDYEQAITAFEKVEAVAPNTKDAVYGLSRAHAALAHKEQASALNAKFRELAQADREDNAAQANAFQDRAYAQGVVALAYADAARIYRMQGKRQEAEDAMLRAIKLDPSNLDFLVRVKELFLMADNKWGAVDAIERIVELDPENLQEWIGLGGLYADLNQPEKVISAFQKAIEIDPTNSLCVQAKAYINAISQP